MSHGAEVEIPHDENNPFVRRVALCVAIFAVLLAIAGMAGKNAGKDMLSAQLDAQNEFSQYQAKSQREVMYIQERQMLEEGIPEIPHEQLEPLAKAFSEAQKDRTKAAPIDALEKRKQRLAYTILKLEEYKVDKDKLMKKGNDFIAVRRTNHRMDGYFDFAELFLQLSIVLASVAMMSKTRWTFSLSLVLALVAMALTAGGFIIPNHAPQVHIPLVDPAHEVAGADAKH